MSAIDPQPIKATFHFFISAFLHCVSIVMPGNLFPGLGSALDAGCGDSLHEELLGKHEEDDDREGQVISCTFGYPPSIFF